MISLLDDALAYLDRGLSIIPIQHKPHTGGKQPAIKRWKPYVQRAPSKRTVRKWFSNGQMQGIGVICGPVSGNLVCRDFDDEESYDRWSIEQPEIATLFPTVKTARGYHVWFRADIESIKRETGAKCFLKLDSGELRFDGVYTLVPPSVHPTGVLYEWVLPLPEGALPIVDPFSVGLACRGKGTESTERRRYGGNRKR